MEISGANTSGTSGASLELKGLQLSKDQQKVEGEQTLQLLESADVPKSSSSNPALGGNIDTYA
ncbi:MAG: hypothetical protein GJ680_13810 [Alteromonadaceae bacterium]|nr:hypothetical protein [Alteromonadaceae bacterium]